VQLRLPGVSAAVRHLWLDEMNLEAVSHHEQEHVLESPTKGEDQAEGGTGEEAEGTEGVRGSSDRPGTGSSTHEVAVSDTHTGTLYAPVGLMKFVGPARYLNGPSTAVLLYLRAMSGTETVSVSAAGYDTTSKLNVDSNQAYISKGVQISTE